MDGDDWITAQEAADISGYHVNYLRWLARHGYIEARKVSIVWLISRKSLLGYMAQAEQSEDKRRGPKASN